MQFSKHGHTSLLPLLLMAGSATGTIAAQDAGVMPTQKILVIAREFTKPGKDAGAHEKTEGEYLKALAGAKTPQHYIGETSLSGPSRALFLYSYPSFTAWEAEHKAIEKYDPAFSAAMEQANVDDGEVLASADSSLWMLNDEMSLKPGYRVGARYQEIEQFTIKPGHHAEWAELVKLVIAAYKKGVPSAHWGMYEEIYGIPGGRYLAISTLKSASEIDAGFEADKQFMDALGEAGLKKLEELEAACVESRQMNLFLIDPKMSYPPDAMVKAEPEFWSVKK